jgi:hypothetical protein
MKNRVLLGMGRVMIPIPRAMWERRLVGQADSASGMLDFMSEEHHRVRNFVVTTLPEHGQPLSPEAIGEHLSLPVDKVNTILDELEEGMFFLYRMGGRSVVWAYPVTVDSTPHRVSYNSGEEGYAA